MTKTIPTPAAAPVPHAGSSPDDQPLADLSNAPLPTEQTQRRRRSLVLQTGRFVAFNVRIMRMVVSGHRASH